MGEVYRARDTRLDREVALKLLPPAFAADPDRLARFEREAKVLASLNHPNIAHLYGFEPVTLPDGTTAHLLAMELVEGEDLAERLKRGPVPIEDAIPIARQIAEALEEAHEKGIVHRDLKPANVTLTPDGKIKVLDFGLAKAWSSDASGVTSGRDVSQSPTLARTGTAAGLILGTAAYMSPEQARARPVDKRTDIWAFGVVLFEMLTGKRLFEGETVSDVLAAVLTREPAWAALPAATPQRMRLLLERCLERDAKLRLRDIGEARVVFERLAAQPDQLPPPRPDVSSRPGRATVVMGLVAALATLGLAWALLTRTRSEPPAVNRLSVLPPEHTSFAGFAVSPDGRQLAFTAAAAGNVRLWVRALDSTEPLPLEGTDGASLPFWSPDSRSIGFFAGGRLKRIDAAGGLVSTLCDVAVGNGATWSREGVILFARLGGTGISRVSASGGPVTPVLAPDSSRQTDLANPFFLPDGRHFLYDVYSGKKETFGVYVASLDGTLNRRLLDDPSNAAYATAGDAGFILFARNGALLAQRFDVGRLRLEGEAFAIAPHVGASLATVVTGVPRRAFSASDNGVLVLDTIVDRQSRRLVWMDRDGRYSGTPGGMEGVGFARLSPDGRHFAVERVDAESANGDIWIGDLAGNASRLTFDPANDAFPLWSADGSRIAWSSNRDGVYQLYQKSASGSGSDSLLLRSSLFNFPTDWSGDGRTLLYRVVDPKTRYDIWALPFGPEGPGKPFPVLQTEANEAGAALSPDGRWIAYTSDESDRYEVYVQGFPAGGGKRQVSASGGLSPQWRSDGSELFYQALDGKLMVVSIERGTTFVGSPPRPLFGFRPSGPLIGPYYSATPDGQRFLLSTIVDTAPGAPLTVVLNWTAAIQK